MRRVVEAPLVGDLSDALVSHGRVQEVFARGFEATFPDPPGDGRARMLEQIVEMTG